MKPRTFVMVLGCLGSAWLWAAGLASQEGAPETEPALKKTVAALSDRSRPPAMDYARMAEETLEFGHRPDAVSRLNSPMSKRADPQQPWRNMVGDALAGVEEGERLDPQAADWKSLRERLQKLQPPPPPPQDPKEKQDQKQKSKKDKKSGEDKKDSPSGQGQEDQKSDPHQQGKGEGQKDSQTPPSQGNEGEGKEGEGTEGDQPKDGEKGGKDQKETKGKSQDPNGVKNFSSSKEGEGKMRERANEKDLKPIQDQEAGFGSLGDETKDKEQGKRPEKAVSASSGQEKKEKKEGSDGMRMVGGGTGKREKDALGTPGGMETMARLDQVRQSDSPALLQQRLQPKDQQPSPGVMGKPW